MTQTMIEWTARRLPDWPVIPGYSFNPWWGCKQWGGRTHSAGGRILDGRTWDEMPPERPVPAVYEQQTLV